MCGISAVFKSDRSVVASSVIERVTAEVAHRGPDGAGVACYGFADGDARRLCAATGRDWAVALGHRRLSIIDLSAAASQPMTYGDRFAVTYNGEIYNYVELRVELERAGHRFRTSADTEVLLAAVAEWGIEALPMLRGMFAFVLLDLHTGKAIVARDRLGIKPLYLWRRDGLLAVVSEIKQLYQVPGFAARAEHEAAVNYLATGFESPTRSFFRDVVPLPAATFVSVDARTLLSSEPKHYWHPERITPDITDDATAAESLRAALQRSVAIHLRSDVPVGCALSGGLDSSAVAVLIDAIQPGSTLATFTSEFPGHPLDERAYADAVNTQISATPHYIQPTAAGFLDDVDHLVWTHDEPIGSLSIYASYCVARRMREVGVPVVLNGQGGDEVLSGYWQSYFMHHWRRLRSGRLDLVAADFLRAALPGGNREMLGQVPAMARRFKARRRQAGAGTAGGAWLDNVLEMGSAAYRVHEITTLFLPRLLKYDDRNSMAWSVEGRYPFLDHDVIETCLRMDPRVLYRSGWTKWPLRAGLKELLPARVARRRSKFGFETPQTDWLRTDLRPTIEQWLREERPLFELVDRRAVARTADSFWRAASGQDEAAQQLFRFYIYDRWMERFNVDSVESEMHAESPTSGRVECADLPV